VSSATAAELLQPRPAAGREKLRPMWPVVITVVVIVPLLLLAWWQMQRRR
jgi:hypothetical protein